MNRIRRGVLGACVAYACAVGQVDTNSDRFYLMTYFLNSSENAGTRLALSSDGLKWQKYNGEAAVITPSVGSKLMRDPMIYFEPATGLFHLVWTTGWSDQLIGYASSKDLKEWSKQTQVTVGAKIANCKCCWAPEIFYDDIKDSCMIFWSTETGSAGKRTYYVMTRDFKTFTDPVKFFDPGYTEIDASMLKVAAGSYYLFFKDERDAGKNIHFVHGSTPQGPWSAVSKAITDAGCEGPSAVKIGGEYRVYFDPYGNSNKSYRMVKTTNLDTSASPWQGGAALKAGSSDFGYSHGSIIEIPRPYVMHLLFNRPLTTSVSFRRVNFQTGTAVMNRSSPDAWVDLLGRCGADLDSRRQRGHSRGWIAPGRPSPAALDFSKGVPRSWLRSRSF
jgi:hypothetical protein